MGALISLPAFPAKSKHFSTSPYYSDALVANEPRGRWKLGDLGICVSGQDGVSRHLMAAGGL